jgi:hypothetical protein
LLSASQDEVDEHLCVPTPAEFHGLHQRPARVRASTDHNGRTNDNRGANNDHRRACDDHNGGTTNDGKPQDNRCRADDNNGGACPHHHCGTF